MDPGVEDIAVNTTTNFLQWVLVTLCANFNPESIPDSDWECRFRSEYYYQLKSLKGKTLKFTTLKRPPLSDIIVDDTGTIKGVGIAFDVIHEIQRRVGFHYNITLPSVNALGNEKYGVIKMLADQEVDMAVVFIPITEVFRKYISFSSSLAEFEWVLMMARPSASASGSGLLAPFQGMVWVLILISLIIAGPTMYLIVYLRTKFSKSTGESRKQYSLPSCVWFAYGALMKQGSTLSPISDSPRLFFATWWIFITILTSFYTANLTAFLTLSEFTLTIKTPKDIYKHKRMWMADKGGYTEALINNEDIFSLLRTTIARQDHFISRTVKERLQIISKGSIYISEKRKAQHYMLENYMEKAERQVPEKDRCTFVLTPKTILTKPVAFGYSKNSTLQALLDPMLTYFVSGGIIGHLLDQNLPLTTICPLNLATRERKLKNEDLLTTYKVVAVGFGSSFIAFIAEVIHRMMTNRKKSKKDKPIPAKQLWNPTAKKEPADKNALNSDLILSQYYREIMKPYNIPYRHTNFFNFTQESNSRHLLPANQPSNFLFQYTN